jgi:phage tail sheath gpL-like
MATINLSLTPSRVGASTELIQSGKAQETAKSLANYFQALAARHESASVDVQTNASSPVAASATITLVSCATDTVTIGGITFTGSGSPTGDVQFETDGNDAADAAALAAKINAHSTLSKIIAATVENNVVTVTCLVKGVIGNFIALTETGSTITCTGSGFLAGGTGGPTDAATSFSF